MGPVVQSDRYISLREVQKIVPVGRATIFRWEKSGLFPNRRKLGPKKVGWLESEIQSWLRSRKEVREGTITALATGRFAISAT